MPTKHTLSKGTSAEKFPFDEGREAYNSRMNHDANPYSKDDWRHNEWCLGWNDAEELDRDEMFDYATDSFKPER